MHEILESRYGDKIRHECNNLEITFNKFIICSKSARRNRCSFTCNIHGVEWSTTNIENFLSRKRSFCPECVTKRKKINNTEDEQSLLRRLKKVCKEYNTEFLFWSEDYKGVTTRFTHRCLIHGTITDNTNVRSLLEGRNKTSGCSDCQKGEFKSTIDNKSDKMVSKFFLTGVYHKDTVFTRSDKVTKAGARNYWNVFCPVCEETNESFTGSLSKGRLPCSCANHIYGFFPKRSDHLDTLYLIKLQSDDECFYKIGRSFIPDRRICNISAESKYICTTISLKQIDHASVYNLEKDLHKACKDFHYNPHRAFGGSITECFTKEILDIPSVVEVFNLNQK